MADAVPPTGARHTRLRYEDVLSVSTLTILSIQVVLLVMLTRKVLAVEHLLVQATRGSAAPTAIVLDRVPDDRGQVLGPVDAPITLVEFSDFQCPYCATAAGKIKAVLAQFPDQVRFVYRHFPLTAMHAEAFQAAVAAECAGEQEMFWEMHDLLFANQDALESSDLQEYAARIGVDMEVFGKCMEGGRGAVAVQQDITDGQRYGVGGTPSVFVNRQMVAGLAELENMVNKALSTP